MNAYYFQWIKGVREVLLDTGVIGLARFLSEGSENVIDHTLKSIYIETGKLPEKKKNYPYILKRYHQLNKSQFVEPEVYSFDKDEKTIKNYETTCIKLCSFIEWVCEDGTRLKAIIQVSVVFKDEFNDIDMLLKSVVNTKKFESIIKEVSSDLLEVIVNACMAKAFFSGLTKRYVDEILGTYYQMFNHSFKKKYNLKPSLTSGKILSTRSLTFETCRFTFDKLFVVMGSPEVDQRRSQKGNQKHAVDIYDFFDFFKYLLEKGDQNFDVLALMIYLGISCNLRFKEIIFLSYDKIVNLINGKSVTITSVKNKMTDQIRIPDVYRKEKLFEKVYNKEMVKPSLYKDVTISTLTNALAYFTHEKFKSITPAKCMQNIYTKEENENRLFKKSERHYQILLSNEIKNFFGNKYDIIRSFKGNAFHMIRRSSTQIYLDLLDKFNMNKNQLSTNILVSDYLRHKSLKSAKAYYQPTMRMRSLDAIF